jgi:endonuclease III
LLEIFRRFRDAEPEPKGELEHVNAYTLLVAVALSAQATDVGVNKATRALFAGRRHAAEDARLGEERLIEHIRTIGLFRNKAKNVMKLSASWSRSMAARCPRRARRCSRCRAWGARPRTWC